MKQLAGALGPDRPTRAIVIVGPADKIAPQLAKFGTVERTTPAGCEGRERRRRRCASRRALRSRLTRVGALHSQDAHGAPAFSCPSLAALRVFEAAGRHLSFTNAAAELCVTTSAVSRQIRALEDELGRPLFERQPRGLALTKDGAVYLGAASPTRSAASTTRARRCAGTARAARFG